MDEKTDNIISSLWTAISNILTENGCSYNDYDEMGFVAEMPNGTAININITRGTED